MASARAGQIVAHLGNVGPTQLLKDQVAIITGAGQGIGASAARLFAAHGARVVVSDLDAKKAQQVTEEIKSQGHQAMAFPGDVMAPDFGQRVVDATIKEYGKVSRYCMLQSMCTCILNRIDDLPLQINHIVNNAGFTADKMAHNMDDATYELMYRVHGLAPFRLIRAAAPHMRIKEAEKRENRSIINVSSTSGLHGNVGQVSYAFAKAGVVGLTKTIAKEWGPFGVRCNTVAFGYILTRLTFAKENGETIEVDGKKIALGIPGRPAAADSKASVTAVADIPLQRAGEPDEAAASMLFLASPLASYVSGHTLEVTGGRGI
ncbi:unnamed protein product [Tilletia controversa]|uniref:3-oxoacyl-[acyl-carrier-protein] reductase FabG n=1 Tax=Tilletia controversa TaxID=13291 RepID=A0A8X7MXJ4_9BASI|nr:hypothetical protein CF328_g1796 [Tilletia controversa]KAE8253457.1 hypothetical protein A4X06_0g1436 [Tilletia controversa]CAD6963868.1 unnamed protein product [Tilletia controversa]CAD6973179.1 unnamed protein product [Tilletia controversa]CAD6977214.1 unnamed protein product [Tilletia controversa]